MAVHTSAPIPYERAIPRDAEPTFHLPEVFRRNGRAGDQSAIQRLVLVGRVPMFRMLVGFRASRHIDGEVPKLGCISHQFHVPLVPNKTRLRRNTQVTQSLQSSIEDDRCRLVGGTVFARDTSHSGSPAAAMLSTRDLNEVDCQVQGVSGVMDCLPAAFPDIVLVPAIASHAFILLASMSEAFE